MFIDETEVFFAAGDGGNGCMSFRREKFEPKGGPNGGNGGKGGDVVLIGDPNVSDLTQYRYTPSLRAHNGERGRGADQDGHSGADLEVRLPMGTVLFDVETERPVAELTEPFEPVVLLRGGRGGLGNINFKSSTNRAPRKTTPGKPGETGRFKLVIKTIADIGLVGFPNAGKSTLLSVLSAARPKIADYEFTTLEPMLGVVRVSDYQSFVMADIPGIIEGAHQGRGLGHQFLRHIQRTSILLFLIDINTPDPVEAFRVLRSELFLYDSFMDKKPWLVVISKLDTLDEERRAERLAEIDRQFQKEFGVTALPVSSVGHVNLEELKFKLFKMLQES